MHCACTYNTTAVQALKIYRSLQRTTKALSVLILTFFKDDFTAVCGKKLGLRAVIEILCCRYSRTLLNKYILCLDYCSKQSGDGGGGGDEENVQTRAGGEQTHTTAFSSVPEAVSSK